MAVGRKPKGDIRPPPIIVLRRTSMRSYPDGRLTALYYGDTIGQYIPIAFGPDTALEEALVDHPQWKEIFTDHYKVLQNQLDDVPKNRNKVRGELYNHMREIKKQYNMIAKEKGETQKVRLDKLQGFWIKRKK